MCPGDNCCIPGEPWSNCFLRLAQGNVGPVCNYLTGSATEENSCDPNAWKPVVDPSIAAQVRYVGFNLFSKYMIRPLPS